MRRMQLSLPRSADPAAVLAWLGTWADALAEPLVELCAPDGSPGRASPALWVALAAGAERRRGLGLPPPTLDPALPGDLHVALRLREPEMAQRGAESSARASAITSLHRARELADATANALESVDPPLPPSVVRLARFVYEELGANVVDHSGRVETGFGIVEPQESGRLQLAFAGCGVGFRESVGRNAELAARIADDAEALQLAVASEVSGTGTGRTNMGIGLAQLVRFSDLLDAELWIASGSAVLQRRSVTEGRRVNTIHAIHPWPGAWICLAAPSHL